MRRMRRRLIRTTRRLVVDDYSRWVTAMRAVIDIALRDLAIHRSEAGMERDNRASNAVARALE
jgi:hypothetical protein